MDFPDCSIVVCTDDGIHAVTVSLSDGTRPLDANYCTAHLTMQMKHLPAGLKMEERR